MFELCDLPGVAARQGSESLPDEYLFRPVTPEELPACAELSGVPLAECRRRHAAGDECYAVFYGGIPVNLNWLHFGACYVCGMGLRIEALASECYVYNIFTAPRHRGHGLYKSTQRHLIALLAQRGVGRIRQLVMVGNTVPTVSLPKFGYTLSEVIRHTRLGGLKFTTVRGTASGAKSYQLSWKIPAGVFRI